MRKSLSMTAAAALVAVAAACSPTVAKVDVSPASAELSKAGETKTLTASPQTAEGQAVEGKVALWSSSDDKVVTVDDKGTITAVGSGEATVTAKVDEVLGNARVVVSILKSASLDKPNLELVVGGEKATLTLALLDDKGAPYAGPRPAVEWTTSDDKVVSVDENGAASAIAPGTATVTAKLGELTASSLVTVKAAEGAPADGAAPVDGEAPPAEDAPAAE